MVVVQLQHLTPASEGGEATAVTLDLGRLLLPPLPRPTSAVVSVEQRTLTGAFAVPAGGKKDGVGGGGGCGSVEWERGGHVRVTLPPGGFCTLEVVVGPEKQEAAAAAAAAAASLSSSPFAH